MVLVEVGRQVDGTERHHMVDRVRQSLRGVEGMREDLDEAPADQRTDDQAGDQDAGSAPESATAHTGIELPITRDQIHQSKHVQDDADADIDPDHGVDAVFRRQRLE